MQLTRGDKMKKIFFENYKDIAMYLYGFGLDGKYASAVLFGDDAVELLREFLLLNNTSIGLIEIERGDYDSYCMEYYVSITPELEIYVEKAYRNGKYTIMFSDVTLISEDANSRVIGSLHKDGCIEISIGEKCECCADCSKLCLGCDGECEDNIFGESDFGDDVEIGIEIFVDGDNFDLPISVYNSIVRLVHQFL